MELTQKELVEAIGKVVPAIAKRELFEQSDKLAFDNGQLVSYNDEVAIFHPLAGSQGIVGAIDGRRLHDLLKKVPEKTEIKDKKNDRTISVETKITLTPNGEGLEVRAGRIKANFALEPVVLPFTEVDQSGDWSDLPNGFKKALGLITGSCAREMSRPVLTCVRMVGDTMIASDTYRVAQFVFPGQELPDLLLPVAPAELVSTYEVRRVAIGTLGEWVRFQTDDETVICARLSTGNYPDLGDVMQVEGSVIAFPQRLREALDRAHIFSRREQRIDEEVSIHLDDRQLYLRAQCDGSQFEETLMIQQSAVGDFSIHPDFLYSVLTEGYGSCVLGDTRIKFTGENWQHVIALR